MAKITHRYIFFECLSFFLTSLAAFLGVLLTLRMLKFASLIINKGVAFSQIARVFLSIIPSFLEIAIPMAALLGIMLAFARLSGDSEIVVMRASGISLLQLLTPVIALGLTFTAVSFVVSIWLRPMGFTSLSNAFFDIAKSRTTSGIDAGVFNKLQNITLYAEQVDSFSGSLEKVLIDDQRSADNRKIILARRGQVLSDAESQTIALLLRDGEVHEIVEGKYALTKYDSNKLVLSPDELFEAGKRSNRTDAMTLTELRSAIDLFEESKDKPNVLDEQGNYNLTGFNPMSPREFTKKLNRMKVEAGRRLSLPMATLLLALIAMPLGIQPPRAQKEWGVGLSALIGLVVFVCYYGILSVGIALSEGGYLHPQTALWLPNIITAALAWYFLKKITSEQWQSIAHGLSFVRARFPKQLRSA